MLLYVCEGVRLNYICFRGLDSGIQISSVSVHACVVIKILSRFCQDSVKNQSESAAQMLDGAYLLELKLDARKCVDIVKLQSKSPKLKDLS